MKTTERTAAAGPRAQASPYLLLALAQLVWSGNVLLARAFHTQITPVGLTFWRWFVAAAILLLLVGPRLWRQRAVLVRRWRILAMLGFLGVTLFNLFLYSAVATTTATNTALIYAAVPILIVPIAWLLERERMTLRHLAGVLVSLAGVVIIITHGDWHVLAGLGLNPGDLWALGMVPVWSLYTVLLRRRPPELDGLSFQAAIATIGVVPLLPAYLVERAIGPTMALTPATAVTVAYLAVMASIVAFVLWNSGAAHVPANKAGLFTHLYPVFTTVLAIALLGERLRVYHLPGVVLILVGLYLTTTARTAGRPPPRPAADSG